MQAKQFDGLLQWRCIGPFRGGRVVAVAGDPKDANVFYFGACAGGVWKTTDGGEFWHCVSDGFFKTSSVGALAVSEADPNVIYAGMGETTIRIDVSHGDGVYKSTDAGRTWQPIGLADTRHIAKIRVHPHNPDIVYVAAFGHAFGPHAERGVYKSTDGGQSWRQVLSRSDRAGAIDLTIDPHNPRILYAAIWEAYRNFWQISSGGPDSSLYKSVDGGETWTEITHNKGLPKGLWGKVAVAISPAQPGRVWALIEHKDGGLWRSDDYGDTWQQVSQNMNLVSRAWYYMHLTADPQDGDTVYVNNLKLWKSSDGGRTFDQITTPHGDNHDLWIDPAKPGRMVQGNDGGACVSYNGGASWSTIYNQPTAQFYHVDVDNQRPFRVYGTQQDNSSLSVPSRSHNQSISWADCYLAGTGESGYIAVKPDDANIVFVGAIGSSPGGGNSLQRYDHRRKQIRLVTTWPEATRGQGAGEQRYRFAWTYPIIFSSHDTNTLYIGGNHVFKTTNEGQSWQMISPDLSRADPEKLLPTGGPVNKDALGAETYATVFALAESPHQPGVLWAGSDDGLLHLSPDGGATWVNVTPAELPEWALISMIEPSPHEPATVYVAATRYKLDDYRPYLYKTTDLGQSWQLITSGIADDDFTRTIREDPNRQGLLYAGTETGLYLSLDGGAAWQRFQLNLPVSPVYDLKVKEGDLVVATHGRSFWILDDLSPLYQYTDAIRAQEAHLFAPRTAVRILPAIFEGAFIGAPGKNYMATLGIVSTFTESKTPEGAAVRNFLDSGENPPKGAIVTYYLKDKPEGAVSLAFSDEAGNRIRQFGRLPQGDKKPDLARERFITVNAGWNRFVWDMRYPPVSQIEGKDPASELVIDGAMVVPGRYQVTLTVGENSYSQPLVIVAEPDKSGSQADLVAQFGLWQQINAKLEQAVQAVNRMRDLRLQLEGWGKRLKVRENGAALGQTAVDLKAKVLAIEEKLLVPDLRPGWPDGVNAGTRLLEKLASLPSVVSLGDYAPTDQAYEAYGHFAGLIDEQLTALTALVAGDLAAFGAALAQANIAPVG